MKGPDADRIKGLFGSISTNYDTANDLMTFGMARLWRQRLVRLSGAGKGDRVLDCATGTGDLALAFKRTVGTEGQVIGSDFCEPMLDEAPSKAHRRGLSVSFEVADVLQLPYADNQFDVVSIAYGIRNVEDPTRALSEMARVTKPGGRVMILETGTPSGPLLAPMISLHFKVMVPLIGQITSGNAAAYQYLNESSSRFPSGKQFLRVMKGTGCFAELSSTSLLGGASYIYRGVVI